jgi:hypothetical protein
MSASPKQLPWLIKLLSDNGFDPAIHNDVVESLHAAQIRDEKTFFTLTEADLLEMGIKILIITNDVVTTEDAKHVQRTLKRRGLTGVFKCAKSNVWGTASSAAKPRRLTRTCWTQQVRWRTTLRGTAGALVALLSWCAGMFSCFNFDFALCVHAAA